MDKNIIIHNFMLKCVDLDLYVLNSINRGSYMSAHVLFNILNELGKEIKWEACQEFYLFFATSLINSIKQEHECQNPFILTLKLF